LRAGGLTVRERIASRLVAIERTDRLVGLAALGVETFAWVPSGAVVGPGVGNSAPEVELLRLGYRSHGQPGRVGRR